MRGSLTSKSIEDKVPDTCAISKLALTSNLKDAAETIIRMESARAMVYGTWSDGNLRQENTSAEIVVSSDSSEPTDKHVAGQHTATLAANQASKAPRATICAFAGPSGTSKAI